MKRRGFDDFGGLRGTPIPIFGGRIDNGVKLLLVLSVVIYVGSILGTKFGFQREWLMMVPALVLKGAVWQFFTASFMHGDPLWFLFAMLMLYSMGSMLESTWGTRKFLFFFTVGGAVTHFCTFLLWCLLKKFTYFSDGTAIIFAMLAGAGCTLSWNAMMMFWFVPMRGKTMFLIFGGFFVLMALQSGLIVANFLIGLGIGHFFVRGLNFRWYRNLEANLKERLRVWRIKRKYKNFKVVDSEMKELWDDLEDRMNRDDKNKNKYIH